MVLFLSACAKSGLQQEPDVIAGKLFSIPTFDGVPTNADIFIKEEETNNHSVQDKADLVLTKQEEDFSSQPVNHSSEFSDIFMSQKCEKAYELSTKDKISCISYYQKADSRLQSIDKAYNEKRFFPILDELGNYQNISSEQALYSAKETAKKLPSTNSFPFVFSDSNQALLEKVDLSELSDGVIVKRVPKKNPMVIDFGKQNATIQLLNITRPYVIVDISNLAIHEELLITSLVDKTAIMPNIIAFNDKGKAIAELVELLPTYQPETLVKYAKVNYTVPKRYLLNEIKYLLIYSGTEYDITVEDNIIKTSLLGRLIFRRN